jgi:hypothetical protein
MGILTRKLSGGGIICSRSEWQPCITISPAYTYGYSKIFTYVKWIWQYPDSCVPNKPAISRKGVGIVDDISGPGKTLKLRNGLYPDAKIVEPWVTPRSRNVPYC